MTKPLSERLEALVRDVTRGPLPAFDADEAALLREAAALARKVEQAPTGELAVSFAANGDFAIGTARGIADLTPLRGQTVALVTVGEG